jgi:hypothetical protein
VQQYTGTPLLGSTAASYFTAAADYFSAALLQQYRGTPLLGSTCSSIYLRIGMQCIHAYWHACTAAAVYAYASARCVAKALLTNA